MNRLRVAAATVACMCCVPATFAREGDGIAVLAAMESELNTLKKEVEIVGRPFEFDGRPVYQARFDGRRLLLARTGATPEAARAIAQWLVGERKVSGVISIGTAGAVVDSLQIGDVVMAGTAVRDGKSGIGSGWKLHQIRGCDVKPVNTITTVGSFVASSTERARLRETYHAEIVDMSAAEIAEACAAQQVPCVIIREISDRADEGAPHAFAETVRAKQPRTDQPALCAIKQFDVMKATDEHR